MRALLALMFLAAPMAHAQAVLVDRITVTVERRAITESEITERMKRYQVTRTEAIDQLVDDTLIQRDAVDKFISVSGEEIDRAIKTVIEQNKLTPEQFAEALKSQGYEEDEYRLVIHQQLIELRWLSQRMSQEGRPTEEAARAEFMAKERQRLLKELRKKTTIEVRP